MFFNGTHEEISDSIESIGAGFAIYEYRPADSNFVLVSCNSLYEDLLGKSKTLAFGQPLLTIFPRYINQPMTASFLRCKSEQTAVEIEVVVEFKGEERFWRTIVSPVLAMPDGNPRVIQTCVEITEKRLLEKKLNTTMRRFEAVVQNAYDGIVSIDSKQNIKLMNVAALAIFGYSEDEVIGAPLTKLIPQKFRQKHGDYVEGFKNSQIDSRPMQTRAAVMGLRKDGTEFPAEITISKISVGDGTEMTAVIRDISEKNKLMEELLIASRRDSLTKLFNRRYFLELITAEFVRFRRFAREFCLLMLDIDYFKKVNDSFGHEAGDEVLKALARVLQETLRETDSVSRWGGEEFLILLPETPISRAADFAERIRTAVGMTAVTYHETRIDITVSIGVCCYNDPSTTIDEIIDRTDKRLYVAKNSGRNRVTAEDGVTAS